MNRTKHLGGKLGLVLCSALLGGATYGQPSVSVGITVPVPSVGVQIRTESDFYEPLAPQGEWVVIGSYGRCWRPSRVAHGWRPYCNGNWQRTDVGWYWVSDEPWAWATYHYGRWDFTTQYGWYWVPQTQWAPAWVSWHEGGGYVGWAPLQPSVSISVNGYVGYSQARIAPQAYVFVEQRRFLEPVRPTTVVVNNTTIINKTTTITNTKMVNNTVFNGGPATAVVEKASGRKTQVVPVQDLRHKEEAPVVAKQRTLASTSGKRFSTPVRSEVIPGETKTVAAVAPAQAQKPTATTHEAAAPAPRNQAPTEKYTPVPTPPKPNLAVTSETRAESKPPTLNNQTAVRNADKSVKKPKKPAKPVDKNLQPPTVEKTAASEKGEPNPSEKSQGNKGKE